ncbi:MAG: bifunctional hydroxymethylpyrimidine kinase/phosphomethylpyrimidine kinase [Brevibacterium sp.]|uniref:bifunctional hydroxymethylpyrimidine kinase/phosphomethylpyrimidine kinase n=1 Tax=Brevibacterium sp. TaxID=1701 RepID=UPI0026491CA2|nr:bifunctional hydroxymethylpyrimidine kinase/phosphomethylpyrimidine kinase [Brevibacterium sp.]MDN5806522.1 bifunctional hydroxymethylpyrimidine kinase/phosphomethylpyrimidine kinase [Brevibacterium sp.]MDN5833147.1 bifunctional hydroxymethylpyrimidine kinase/phosphomethylpyrimidine kinase [Brevibacterium sp.]MDN5876487.1 bifunctional hydroxymethylpyrimidine kinase/phosphomethylpyrimidine kinase [Brevibacterium sp.]MDN5908678.1 bifunctional hydroxymethylpyrimidine kinase/phosphomethylpyrimid
MTIKNVLSIAGTDPTGGAGIHADLKAFSAMGAYGMAAITAVVAQNTRGVRSFVPLDPSFVGEQIDAVFNDVRVEAVKIGMVANAAIAEVIAERLHHHEAETVVLDPVMVAKSGHRLLDDDAVAAIRDTLVPLATVITPNLPEAAVLLDTEDVTNLRQMEDQATQLRGLSCQWALLKGGHLTSETVSVDYLAGPDGISTYSSPRVWTLNDHGTGCTLSSAITALLPGHSVPESVDPAKTYLQDALVASDRLNVGQGHGPLHHFHQFWPRG